MKMAVSDPEGINYRKHYKLQPPEGGWGFVLTIAMAFMLIVTVGPLAGFGIIYGKFLAELGDEASGTAIVNCFFFTIQCFMGLVANHLLRRRSYRFVGITGGIIFFLGNFLTAFTTSLTEIVITFGVLQGIGFGLILPAMYASFNEYFIIRKNFMMGICQTIIAAAVMVIPYLTHGLINEYGFRGTVAIVSALSLHAFAAALTLQPVQWHMIKVPVSTLEMSFLPPENDKTNEKYEKNNDDNAEHMSQLPTTEDTIKSSTMSKLCNWISIFLELSLFRDPSYVNIAFGLALSFMSDIMFISLLPMFLNHMDYNHEEIAYLMTVFMASDLLGRLLLSVLTAAVKINNRILFLLGSAVTAIIRIVFTYSLSAWVWKMILIILLGLFRCLIQVTVPLVLAEYSQTKFPAAFSVYLAISGVVSLATGQFSSIVAKHTTGDAWVQHFLSMHMILCVVLWSIELTYKKFR